MVAARSRCLRVRYHQEGHAPREVKTPNRFLFWYASEAGLDALRCGLHTLFRYKSRLASRLHPSWTMAMTALQQCSWRGIFAARCQAGLAAIARICRSSFHPDQLTPRRRNSFIGRLRKRQSNCLHPLKMRRHLMELCSICLQVSRLCQHRRG